VLAVGRDAGVKLVLQGIQHRPTVGAQQLAAEIEHSGGDVLGGAHPLDEVVDQGGLPAAAQPVQVPHPAGGVVQKSAEGVYLAFAVGEVGQWIGHGNLHRTGWHPVLRFLGHTDDGAIVCGLRALAARAFLRDVSHQASSPGNDLLHTLRPAQHFQ